MLLFFTTSMRSLIQGSYELGLGLPIEQSKGSAVFLAVIPSLYLYYKNLVNRENSFRIKDLKHYGFIVFIYLTSIPAIQNSVLFYYGSSITYFTVIAAFTLFYIWTTFNLLKNKLWNKADLQSIDKHHKLIKSWTVYSFILTTIGTIIFLSSIYPESTEDTISMKKMSIPLALCWLFIYFKILFSPEILHGLSILNKKILTLNNSIIGIHDHWELSPSTPKDDRNLRLKKNIKNNILNYANGLDHLSYTATIFRNSKVSLSDLANEMRIPASHIVYVFKYHSKISFSEYRTHSRIQDAISLMHKGFLEENTLQSLAYKTGFSSYDPFFKAFKKVTTYAPQEYIKKQKNLKA